MKLKMAIDSGVNRVEGNKTTPLKMNPNNGGNSALLNIDGSLDYIDAHPDRVAISGDGTKLSAFSYSDDSDGYIQFPDGTQYFGYEGDKQGVAISNDGDTVSWCQPATVDADFTPGYLIGVKKPPSTQLMMAI